MSLEKLLFDLLANNEGERGHGGGIAREFLRGQRKPWKPLENDWFHSYFPNKIVEILGNNGLQMFLCSDQQWRNSLGVPFP